MGCVTAKHNAPISSKDRSGNTERPNICGALPLRDNTPYKLIPFSRSILSRSNRSFMIYGSVRSIANIEVESIVNSYNRSMEYAVEYTNEFADWWEELSTAQQDDVNASVELLMSRGVNLKFPHSSGINGSRHSHMRELRVQSAGNPIRIFYAFDPRRCAILLIGGDKAGNNRFYDEYIPIADRLYDIYLEELTQEGLIE